MRVYRSLADVPSDFGPSVLTIGNFDGVHYGHRQILRRVISLAAEHGWKPSVLTFDPHPTRVVAPDRMPPLMTSPEVRAELMAEEGIEQVLILPFTQELALLTPEEFARKLLVETLGARVVLVGDNFRFGCRQAGNVSVLNELGRELGFQTEVLGAVRWRGRIVSSSAIRQLIGAGNVSQAARLLTRPYAISGEIVKGHGIGSRQTVPTLNLATTAQMIPASGVYITRTEDLATSRTWNSITNIGHRPTFGQDQPLSIETFLLDPIEGVAPTQIRLQFLRRVRDERQFATPDALRAQILRDVGVAQRYFRRLAVRTGSCISY
jgi:riboflavin kinase / FMN adenylyltransferase